MVSENCMFIKRIKERAFEEGRLQGAIPYQKFVADLRERLDLHDKLEPSEYILADLNLWLKSRLKELKKDKK